jgi:hypothetical protein
MQVPSLWPVAGLLNLPTMNAVDCQVGTGWGSNPEPCVCLPLRGPSRACGFLGPARPGAFDSESDSSALVPGLVPQGDQGVAFRNAGSGASDSLRLWLLRWVARRGPVQPRCAESLANQCLTDQRLEEGKVWAGRHSAEGPGRVPARTKALPGLLQPCVTWRSWQFCKWPGDCRQKFD